MFFMVFHGKPRMAPEEYQHVKESPWTITLPLIILAIPSVFVGFFFMHADLNGFFGTSIFIAPSHPVMNELQNLYQTPWGFFVENAKDWPCLLAFLGIMLSYLAYVRYPKIPVILAKCLPFLQTFLVKKYYIDSAYDYFFTGCARLFALISYRVGDIFLIDHSCVDGSARGFNRLGMIFKRWQTGLLYHYTLAMVTGVLVVMLFIWFNH
jgi:NADH-quinone oxidoreductase subunit L